MTRKRDAPQVFWEIVWQDDPARRRELAEEFLELRQFEEDGAWLDAQGSHLRHQNKKSSARAATARSGKQRAIERKKRPIRTLATKEWRSTPALSVNAMAEIIKRARPRCAVANSTLRSWIADLKPH